MGPGGAGDPEGIVASVDRDEEALLFFNKLSGRLDIRLTEPTQPFAEGLHNEVAPPSARSEAMSLSLQVVERHSQGIAFRDLTEEEWNRVVMRVPVVRLRGLDELAVEHRAPNGVAFTVRDLAAAVAETERQTR